MGILECLVLSSGYIASFCSNVLATLGSACAQLLQEAIPTFQLNLSRYVFQVAICAMIVLIRKENVRIDSKLVPPLLLAGLFSNLFNISYYTASALLPLGTLIMITNVTQVINSCVINKIFFDKSIQPMKYIFIVLMIIGAVFILQPEFLFGEDSLGAFGPAKEVQQILLNDSVDIDSTNVISHGLGVKVRVMARSFEPAGLKSVFGIVLGMIAGMMSTSRGAVYRSRLSTLTTSTLGLWIGILGVVPSITIMFYMEDINIKLTAIQIAFVFGHGFGAASYSTLGIYAQQNLSPVTWAMMDNSKLVFNFILQYTLLSGIHPGNMNAFEILGAIIANIAIVGGVILDIKAGESTNTIRDIDKDLDFSRKEEKQLK